MKFENVVERIKLGDEELLCKIYSAYRNSFIVFGQAKYQLDSEILKEVFQDTMLAFHKNIVQGKLEKLSCSVKTYLFGIGKNLILKEVRKRKNTIHLHENTKGDDFLIYDEQENEPNIEILIKELELLGEKCYQILYSFYFKNLRMDVIAEKFNYSNVDSVKTQKYKCMERLKKNFLERIGRL